MSSFKEWWAFSSSASSDIYYYYCSCLWGFGWFFCGFFFKASDFIFLSSSVSGPIKASIIFTNTSLTVLPSANLSLSPISLLKEGTKTYLSAFSLSAFYYIISFASLWIMASSYTTPTPQNSSSSFKLSSFELLFACCLKYWMASVSWGTEWILQLIT